MNTIKQTIHIIICIGIFGLFAQSAFGLQTQYKDLNGKILSVDLAKPGKATVLVFWASWCPYCMAEIPTLKQLHSQSPELQWLGVNVNKTVMDGLNRQNEKAIPYRSISDPELKIADKYAIQGTPGFIILDKNGKLIHRGRKADKHFVAGLNKVKK